MSLIRKVLIAGTAALAVAGLSGCALGVRIPKADMALPTAYESPQSAAGAALPAQTLDRWWISFDDPQLTALIEEALVSAPDAKSALARLREAKFTYRENVATALLPAGKASGSAAKQNTVTKFSGAGAAAGSTGTGANTTTPFLTPSGDSEAYNAAFNVSWELDLFGRNIAAVRALKADAAAERFDYEATRMSLAANVASSLFQARGLAVQLDDAKENARLAGQIAEVGRKKTDIGIATTADAARLESDAGSADAQVAAVDAQLKGAQRSLLILVGQGTAPSVSLPIDAKVSPPPPVPAQSPGSLLARRPDVREAEARVRSAAARLHFDKLAILPTFTLQPGVTYSKQSTSLYIDSTRVGSIGVGVSQPIFEIPKMLYEVRAQGARGEQAVAAYEKAIATAYGDAEKGLTTLQADETRVELLRMATDKARFAFDAANKGYSLGLTDLTVLVQAEQAWRQTRATYTAAQISALQDTVATFKALGGGWDASGKGDKGQ